MKKKVTISLLLIWTISVLFYSYTRFLSKSSSSLGIFWQNLFNIDTTEIALSLSAFSLALILMKLPVGFCIDRYSIKKPLIFAMIMAIIGNILLLSPTNQYILYGAEFFIGIGTAFALVSSYKITSITLDKKLFALITGIIYFIGSMAVSFAGAPLAELVKNFNYFHIVLLSVIFGFIILVLFIFVSKGENLDVSETNSSKHIKDYLKDILLIFKDKQVILVILYGAIYTVIFVLIISFWGAEFLQKVKGLDNVSANIYSTSIISSVSGLFAIVCGVMIYYNLVKKSLIRILATLSTVAIIIMFFLNVKSGLVLGLCSFLIGLNYAFTGISMDTINKRQKNLLATCLILFAVVESSLLSVFFPLISYVKNIIYLNNFNLITAYKGAFCIILILSILANIIAFYIVPQKSE